MPGHDDTDKSDYLASFCRETHAFEPMRVNYPIKPGQIDGRCRHAPCHLGGDFRRKGRGGAWNARLVATKQSGVRSAARGRLKRYGYAAFRLHDDRCINKSAIFMRLLARTAAATHISKRSRPSARQRFMPRPRNNTEMRPSMPARKRWPFLNSELFSYASRSGALAPPRCGMHTTLTPSCLRDATLCSLKNPRSDPYKSGAWPKACLWHFSEGTTCCSSTGFPSSTSYWVIRPRALSARNTLWPNSMGVCTLPRLMRSVWGSKI